MPVILQSNLIKALFQNVYFINGTAYAGKSTMVKMLSEKHNGIFCGENYHEVLMHCISKKEQPHLSYFDTMRDWQEFLNRTPEEYANWIEGCNEEAAQLEILYLLQLIPQGKKIFVDTNLSPSLLHEIAQENHVALLLSEQSTSVERFFDREDPEKQFLLSQIAQAADPQKTMANFKACLQKINSPKAYDHFEKSGFFVLKRDDHRSLDETLALLETHFGL